MKNWKCTFIWRQNPAFRLRNITPLTLSLYSDIGATKQGFILVIKYLVNYATFSPFPSYFAHGFHFLGYCLFIIAYIVWEIYPLS
jgi:hypothetical protein